MSSSSAAAVNESFELAEVVECRFLRYNCDHPVFQKEYTRSNRRRKTKILRCFPHCCPEHLPRCYCGCSIHILVTFKDASLVNDSELIVCARFEASSDDYQRGNEDAATRELAEGELVVLPPDVLQPMPQDSVESLWIRAYREGEGKQQSVPENSILYVMNNYRFPKWYYGYESGSTKSQREMKHYLRAYVLRLERPRDLPINWSDSWIASVVARHSSTGFTLISYRRAGDSTVAKVKQARRIAEGDTIEGSSTESERNGLRRLAAGHPTLLRHARQQDLTGQRSSSYDPSPHSHHDNAEGILLGLKYGDRGATDHFLNISSPEDFDQGQDQDHDIFRDDVHPQQQHYQQCESPVITPEPRRRQYPPVLEHYQGLPRDVDEKLFWRQPTFVNTVERARQLSVIQYFVTHVDCDELWNPILGLEDRLRQCWTESLYNNTRDERTRETLAGFRLPSPKSHHHQYDLRHDDRGGSLFSHHPVLVRCAELSVELLTSHALQAFIRSTLQVDFSAMSTGSRKLELRHRFAALVDGIYAHTSAFLGAERRLNTVGELVDGLVTLVHQNQRFRWMQTSIRELLEMTTPDRVACEAFCAQAREVSMQLLLAQSGRQQIGSALSAGRFGGQGRRWSRRWLLNSRSLRVCDVDHEARSSVQFRAKLVDANNRQFSAWELLATIQQFGAIDMELDSSASLRVHSVFNASSQGPGGIRPMHLVLDSKNRIFQTFPDGISTMAVARDGWVYGDYFGYLESPSSIKIWFFTYKDHSVENGGGRGGDTPARCISAHVTLAAARDPWQTHHRGSTPSDHLLHVTVKISDAMCPSQEDQDLSTMASGARHAIWKALHWKPCTEFEIEYQQLQ